MQSERMIDELFELMHVLSHLVKDQVKAQNQDFLFTPANVEIVRFVIRHGNPTMKEIADYLHISAPAATAFIDSLIKSGYIERVADEKDRRVIRVSLTDLGKKKMGEFRGLIRSRFTKVLGELTEEQKEHLYEILGVLIKKLK